MERYEEFKARHPRARLGAGVIGGSLAVVGLAGLPDDLKNWGAAFQAIDSDLGRWLLVFIGLAVIAAVTVTRGKPHGHSHQDQAEPASTTRRGTHGDIAAMRVPVNTSPIPTAASPPTDTPMKALQTIQAMFDEAKRQKLTLIEVELVAMIDEGVRLSGDEFSGNPTLADFDAWRGPIVEFVGTVFGATEKQRLLEVKWNGYEVRDHIAAVLDWLRTLRDRPDSWRVEIDGEEVETAIQARHGNGRAGAETLAHQLDSLIREGRELVSELSSPVQPEKLNWVSKIVGGGPPAEWQEKADAFRQRSMALLEARHPALLTDFRDGMKKHFAMEREAREQREQESRADTRPDGEKMLALANYERSGPRREVEACLEGLALARKSI